MKGKHTSLGRPIVIFDGECTLCLFFVEKAKQMTGERVRYRSYQSLQEGEYGVERASYEKAVHWVEGDTVFSGARAVVEVLRFGGKGSRVVRRWALAIPGGMLFAGWIYQIVARHRGKLATFFIGKPCSRGKKRLKN